MEDQFTTYEIAIMLKELGYDEPCFGYFEQESKQLIIYFDNRPLTEEQSKRPGLFKIDNRNSVLPQWAIAAPLKQQVEEYLLKHFWKTKKEQFSERDTFLRVQALVNRHRNI